MKSMLVKSLAVEMVCAAYGEEGWTDMEDEGNGEERAWIKAAEMVLKKYKLVQWP